ncbi:MAG TPA: RsmE family RNA methyltransferase [Thermoanaerobaculia bacterium]|nr:RsmE family RNA methyltransferase [Thermoanaerobaculia bacterium]
MERTDRAAAVTFFSTDSFASGVSVTLGDDAAQHARVLRIGSGERVELRDGKGNGARGTLGRVAKRSLSVDIEEVWQIPDLPPVHRLGPVADRDRMLYLAEKCTELGATSWRPVMWRRSRSVGPAGDGPAFQSRLKGRMIAALTQSGGGWLPEIHPSAPLARAIAAAPDGARFLLDAFADRALISSDVAAPVTIAVGPEGGLDPREREEIVDGGFVPASLVGGTLRFETAGMAGLAIVRSMLGAGVETSITDEGQQ